MKNKERCLINIDVDFELREKLKTAGRILNTPYSQLVLESALAKLKENNEVSALFSHTPSLFVDVDSADLEALRKVAEQYGVPVEALAKEAILNFIAAQ